jgi:hypothetical protein
VWVQFHVYPKKGILGKLLVQVSPNFFSLSFACVASLFLCIGFSETFVKEVFHTGFVAPEWAFFLLKSQTYH